METSNGPNFFHIANQGKPHFIIVLVGPTESSTCPIMAEVWVFPIVEGVWDPDLRRLQFREKRTNGEKGGRPRDAWNV